MGDDLNQVDKRRFVPRSAAPHEVYANALAGDRIQLALHLGHHLDLAKRFLSASDGSLYSIDLFLAGAAQRSYHLVEGFLATWDQWNVIAAAPLVRMQLDTLIRVSYVATAERSDDVVDGFLRADSFRSLRDADGQKLTDRVLVDAAADDYPWLPPVYEKSNEWVHFSTRHIFNTWSVGETEDRLIGRIPLTPQLIPVSFLAELIGAMLEATRSLFGLLEVWEGRKGRPLGEFSLGKGSDT